MKGLEVALKANGMTNTDLAEALGGIAKQNISRWISGDRKIPDKYFPAIEKMLYIKKEELQEDLNRIDEVNLLASIYNRKGAAEHNDEIYHKAIELWDLADALVVEEKVGKILKDYVDGYGLDEILDIYENVSKIINFDDEDSIVTGKYKYSIFGK